MKKKDKNIVHDTFNKLLKKILPSDQREDFLAACKKPLKKSITINTTKISIENFLRITEERWRILTPAPFLKDTHTFYIDRKDLDIALGNTFLYQAGFFYIQEVAASLSAPQIQWQWKNIILDMAAAPWGKSSQLAKGILRMHNINRKDHVNKDDLGLIVSNDVESKRVWTLVHNLRQWGYFNTLITKFNGQDFWEYLPNFFDHVLLDAPCSGEGTGFKSDMAMQFRHQAEINKMCGLQSQLLSSAIKTVKVWWTVVYSTCTLNPFENEWVLAKILSAFGKNVKLESVEFQGLNEGIPWQGKEWQFDDEEKVARCWPHIQKTGWFFIAKMRKFSDPNNKSIKKHHKLLPRNQQWLKHNKGLQKEITKWLEENRWIQIDETQHFFLASKEQIYLSSPTAKSVLKQLHPNKVWIPILKRERKGYRPTHYLWNILGHLATKNVINLDDEQAQRYSEGHNIPLSNIDLSTCEEWQKHFLLTRKTYGLSITKIVNDELKNKWRK